MDNKILLPNTEQAAKMLENSWREFRKRAIEAGWPMKTPVLESFAEDLFVAGYCYGHNDSLSVVRGQLEAMDIVSDIFKEEP